MCGGGCAGVLCVCVSKLKYSYCGSCWILVAFPLATMKINEQEDLALARPVPTTFLGSNGLNNFNNENNNCNRCLIIIYYHHSKLFPVALTWSLIRLLMAEIRVINFCIFLFGVQ